MKYFLIFLAIPILATGLPCLPDSRVKPAPSIVPDVVDVLPSNSLTIKYGQNEVKSGNQLTPRDVEHQPKMDWSAKPDTFYFLAFIDPEANNFIHWMVGNIPGSNLEKGQIMADYVGSGPRNGTGLHRYVFLLYEQPSKLEFTEPKMPPKIESINLRLNFDARKFSTKYTLGSPIASNFYLCEWDEYVPIVFANLSRANSPQT